MNELALFAGAGGGLLASELLGWKTICAVENNPFCIRRLQQRQNEGHLPCFPIWDDVRTFDGRHWKKTIDVVSGGFPCQAFSSATRGNTTAIDLWPEMFRIIGEVEPREVFAENVALKAIEQAARDCESLGYKTKVCALSAKDLGADHIRKRYWLRAYTDVCRKLRSKEHAEASELPQFCPRIWEGKTPRECGIPDGLANRMDRLIAIGNGQVPAVAAAAWTILTQ